MSWDTWHREWVDRGTRINYVLFVKFEGTKAVRAKSDLVGDLESLCAQRATQVTVRDLQ